MSHQVLPYRVLVPLLTLAVLVLGSVPGRAGTPNPYGDCCVSQVTPATFNTWTAVCGQCATNPGTFTITQPDPASLTYTGPNGVTAASPADVARKVCQCPAEKKRRDFEKTMRAPAAVEP